MQDNATCLGFMSEGENMGFPKTSKYTVLDLKAEYEAARIAVTYTSLEGRYLQETCYTHPYMLYNIHPNRRIKELDDGREEY